MPGSSSNLWILSVIGPQSESWITDGLWAKVDQYPSSYFKVIKNPMDLSTMSVKLNNGLYKDRAGFEADFRLMINNSKTYNPQGTYVHGEAVGLEQFFDKR